MDKLIPVYLTEQQWLAVSKAIDVALRPEPSGNWWKGDPTCGGIAENYMAKKEKENE
jgi:hypothetical protein